MPVDFEKFGEKPFVDDRWTVERIGRLALPADTNTFMIESMRRVFDSERIAWDWAQGGPMVSDDEWNLLQFALAFAGEAQKDIDPALVSLILDMPASDRFGSKKLLLRAVSATHSYDEEPFTMNVFDDSDFFRNMVMYLQAAFGVADTDLTMPDEEWQPAEQVVNGWRLVKSEAPEAQTFTIEKTSS